MHTILIVEDEAIIAEDLRETLLSLGFAVCAIADTAEDAIRLVTEHQPDVVLMDIYLKGDKDGIDAARTITREQALPIVFLTAHADISTFERAKAVRPAAYLYKPFDRLTLQTTLDIALDRHRLEQTLQLNERRYRLLFDMAKDAILLVERESGVILDCNPATTELYGRDRLELIGQTAEILSNEPEKTMTAIRQGDKAIALRWHRKKDGTVFPVAITSCVFELDGQEVVLSSIRDTSERIQAERALREAEERWNVALTGAGDGIWDWNTERDQVYISAQGAAMLGFTEGGMTFTPEEWLALIHADDQPRCHAAIKGLLSGEESSFRNELRIRRQDGSYLWVLSRGKVISSNSDTTPRRIAGTLVDIGERKRLEGELREKETYLHTIIESAPECITLHNRDGALLSMNRAGLAMVGAESLEQVRGLCISSLIRPQYRQDFTKMTEAAFQGLSSNLEFEIDTMGGRRLWLSSHAVPLRNAEDEIIASLKVTRDITDKKLAEQELIKTQKLESLGIMAGGIAHDFNNLLTGILGGVSMARNMLPRDSGLDDILQIAEESCNRAKELSYRLLTFAKGGDPIRKPIALGRALMHATTMALSGSAIIVSHDIAADLCPVEADEGQLLQVFSNIALNAKEAMGGTPGNLQVRAWNLPAAVDGSSPAMVRLTFTDNGPGITADILAKVFDPYFSTKGLGATKGQGLGLTICHSIIRKHGGRIDATSQPGQGTTITIDLPAIASAAPAALTNSRFRALIMDDEIIFQRVLSGMLTHVGIQAESASTSEEAVALMEKAVAAGRPYDIAFLDLTIPGGKGGLETVTLLAAMHPGLRSVITSGYINNPILHDYQQHGFTAAIAKPFTLEQLRALTNRLLSAA